MNYKTDKILLNQLVEQKRDVFTIEDSIIIPDIKPDILGIITTSSNLYVYKKEINNGKVRVDGGILVDMIYTADDEKNSIRAIHNVLDFSKSFDVEKYEENNTFSCTLNVKSLDPKIVNGRKVGIDANIEYELRIYSNNENEFICSIDENEDVQKISRSIDISALSFAGESICSAKDSITLEDNLADILCCNLSIMNREEKISYNKVLSKADCKVDVIYINEDENIRNITHIVPVMGFIDMPGIDEEEIIITNYEIRNINIKPDSGSNNKILIDIDFGVRCDSYENKKIEIIEDLYSPEQEITLYQSNADLMQNRSVIKDSFNISEQIDISDVKDNNIYFTNITNESINQKIVGNSVIYEGSIRADILFESNISGRWEQKSKSIDYSHSVKIENLNENTVLNTNMDIGNTECRAVQNGTLELNLGLNLNIIKYNRFKTNFICNMKTEEGKNNTIPNSLIIYFIKDGDSLWKIAKKFKTTIDEIAEINNIENVDKIETGEQLFIPRHVNAKAY